MTQRIRAMTGFARHFADLVAEGEIDQAERLADVAFGLRDMTDKEFEAEYLESD